MMPNRKDIRDNDICRVSRISEHGALYDLKKPVSLFLQRRKNICKKNVVEIGSPHLKKAERKKRMSDVSRIPEHRPLYDLKEVSFHVLQKTAGRPCIFVAFGKKKHNSEIFLSENKIFHIL